MAGKTQEVSEIWRKWLDGWDAERWLQDGRDAERGHRARTPDVVRTVVDGTTEFYWSKLFNRPLPRRRGRPPASDRRVALIAAEVADHEARLGPRSRGWAIMLAAKNHGVTEKQIRRLLKKHRTAARRRNVRVFVSGSSIAAAVGVSSTASSATAVGSYAHKRDALIRRYKWKSKAPLRSKR